MSAVNFVERRQSPRHRVGRLATIKLGVGIEPRYVLVTNASPEGVRLQLNGIRAGRRIRAALSWQRGCQGRYLQSCLAAGSGCRRQVHERRHFEHIMLPSDVGFGSLGASASIDIGARLKSVCRQERERWQSPR